MEINSGALVIECKCIPCHDWMAFASWYSIKKVLPDLDIRIDVNIDRPIFRWSRVLPVPEDKRDIMRVLSPTVMAVRDFEGDWSISSSKSNSQTCFVDYSDGCGNFVVGEWINSDRVPFHRALKRFGTANMTVNEVAILKLWEKCNDLYRFVGA